MQQPDEEIEKLSVARLKEILGSRGALISHWRGPSLLRCPFSLSPPCLIFSSSSQESITATAWRRPSSWRWSRRPIPPLAAHRPAASPRSRPLPRLRRCVLSSVLLPPVVECRTPVLLFIDSLKSIFDLLQDCFSSLCSREGMVACTTSHRFAEAKGHGFP